MNNVVSRWLALEANTRWEKWGEQLDDDQLYWLYTSEFSPHSCYSGPIGTVCIVKLTPNDDCYAYCGDEGFKYIGLLFPAGRTDIFIIIVEKIEFSDGKETKENWNFEQISLDETSVDIKDLKELARIARNCASTYNWSYPTPLYMEAIMRAKTFSKQKI